MGLRGYCRPAEYAPQPASLYRNDGDGTFTDVSRSAGIAARASTGLGVVAADFDRDGRVDIYVANDQRPNFLWMNNGDGTFREEALERGCALSGMGFAQAGMGVAVADPEGDGDWDLFVVNLSSEGSTYYRNAGDGNFLDATDELGLGVPTQPYTGFGTALFDYDGDALLDVFIANGKVVPGDSVALLEPARGRRANRVTRGAQSPPPAFDYREPNLLLHGPRSGTFEDVTARSGPAFARAEVSRGAAFGDVDNDGDVDILIATNDGPARLLRNETGGERHWLMVRLHDATSKNVDGIGAEITVRAGGRVQRRLVQTAYSYCAANDPRAHFGLGDADDVESLELKWPDGTVQPSGAGRRRSHPVDRARARSAPVSRAAIARPGRTRRRRPRSRARGGGAPAARRLLDRALVDDQQAGGGIDPTRRRRSCRCPGCHDGAARWRLDALDPAVAAAIRDAVAAVEREPSSGARWGELGIVYHAHRYFALADRCYARAAALDPRAPDWPHLRGVLAEERGDVEAAAGSTGPRSSVAGRPSRALSARQRAAPGWEPR